jgi:hypothetical protein
METIMEEAVHSLAPHQLPVFLPGPDGSDFLFTTVVVVMIVVVLLFGVIYFSLHALPEKIAHGASSTQFQLIGVLALLAMFTHNNAFWIAALLLATVKLPDFTTPLNSISRSLEELKNREPAPLQPSPAPLQSSDVTSGIQPEPEGPEESEEASQAEGDDPEAESR